MNNIMPDKYNIAELVENIKSNHIQDVNQNALLMSTFGLMGELFTTQINSDLMAMSEISNEAMAIKAKYDRDIITHAIQANVTNLYAVPAYMDVSLYIPEKVIDQNITNNSNTLVIDKNTPIYIEDFEFRFDYDIIITRSKPYNYSTDGYAYIAQYDTTINNVLSNIETPYLIPPVKINYMGDPCIIVRCRIRQVEYMEINNKILSDDTIENKTFEFEFDSQLAYFDILATDPDGTENLLIPVFEGVPLVDKKKKYVYYTHIDANTIRVKFISSYYNPALNTNIQIRIYTTQGEGGNFTYSKSFLISGESDRFSYKNLIMTVVPYTDSDYGTNMKTIDDLKREIPMRILARESLTSMKDLQNYFNILNDMNTTMTFDEYLHNQNALKFYGFLLMKNNIGNIVPTNTLPLQVSDDYLKANKDVIKPGTVFHYNTSLENSEISYVNPMELDINTLYNEFYYSTPFLIKVSSTPVLHLSFYMNIIDISYITDFSYINRNAFLQFICTTINIKREFLKDHNKYILSTSIIQNIDTEYDLVDKDKKGNIIDSRLRAFFVFFDQYGNPVKHKACKVVSYDKNTMEYGLEAELLTEDEFDDTGNFLNITNLNDFGAYTTSDTYLPRQTKIMLYVAYNLGDDNTDLYDASKYVPDLEGYVVSNVYTIDPGIELFINFSEITNSVIRAYRDKSGYLQYRLASIPMIQYNYMQNEDNVTEIVTNLLTRKLYIDESMKVIQDPLGIDFKLYNTYGPSRTFKVGHENIELDRINISLKLRMKFKYTAQDNMKDIILTDIKSYIENINNIVDFHYSNLDQYLRNKYPNIIWIEFVGINKYSTDNQYIRKDNRIVGQVPEFININVIDNTPDIEITIV